MRNVTGSAARAPPAATDPAATRQASTTLSASATVAKTFRRSAERPSGGVRDPPARTAAPSSAQSASDTFVSAR